MACPEGYDPDPEVLAFARERTPACFPWCTPDILEAAAKDADVVFTDVWASMGQEEESAQR